MREEVLPFEQARRVVEEHARGLAPTTPEEVPLEQAAGRILAESLLADRDFPPFNRSARDGYAVRATDARAGARLQVIGEIRAGAESHGIPQRVSAGQAAAIMTGAPAPAGADAVIMVEHTRETGGMVELQRAVEAGENIVPRGQEARGGDELLSPGTRLMPAAIAVAASVGRTRVRVHRRPRVAVLATGDEVVNIAAAPGPHQIRNSNSYSLAAQVELAGGSPVRLPIAPDEPQELRRLIAEGLACDLLLITGGVSMGKYDLVEQVLQAMGADAFFTGALIQPGRPVLFGRAPRPNSAEPVYFLGLPGNPVSTLVTFELFARPVLEALAGQPPRRLVFLRACLRSEVRVKPGLTRFLPAVLAGEFGRPEVEPTRWHGSGDIAATALSNCFLVVPPDRERVAAGEDVGVLAPGAQP